MLDRWHLIRNLQEALVRLRDCLRSQLQRLLATQRQEGGMGQDAGGLAIDARDKRRGTLDQLRHEHRRARRYEVFAAVKQLHQAGRNILQIARDLAISRQTVRRYIACEYLPEPSARPNQPSILDPYVAYLQQRWEAGCRANKELYAEIVAQGYPGSSRALAQWTRLRRDDAAGGQRQYGRRPARAVEVFVAEKTVPPLPAGTAKLPGSAALAWLLLANEATVAEQDKQMLVQLKQEQELSKASDLAQRFLALIRQRQPEELAGWLAACQGSELGELATFAAGLQREEVNVRAALECRTATEWRKGM